MVLKWIKLTIFLLTITFISCDEDFSCEKNNDKMVNFWTQKMQKEGKLFISKIEMVDLVNSNTLIIGEKYDFTLNIGHLKYFTPNSDELKITKNFYFDDYSYEFDSKTSSCVKKNIDNPLVKLYSSKWVPEKIYLQSTVSYFKLLGPSALLLQLNINLKETHKYEIIDSDNIINFGFNFCVENFMIKYFMILESSIDEYIIKKIEIYEKVSDEYKILKQFNYFHVQIKQDKRLNKNLPIGKSCSNLEKDFKTNLFNFDQAELDFKFLQNQVKNYLHEDKINDIDIDNSIITYHKLFFDNQFGLSTNLRQSSVINGFVLSVHDHFIETIFDINLTDGLCSLRNELTNDLSVVIDFDDPLSIIKNIPELFKLNEEVNYLGQFITKNIDCKVFETKFSLYVNDAQQYFIVTHYYSSSGFELKSTDKLPIRIDLRQFSDENFNIQQGYYVFFINTFKTTLSNLNQEVFDISTCLPSFYKSSWFVIKFSIFPEDRNYLKFNQLSLLNLFRKNLGLSNLRVPKILIDFESDSIYFTSKLLDIPAVENHFKSLYQAKLLNPQFTYLTDHEENCAKSCLLKQDCVAYSFCINLQCSQLILENYGSDPKKKIPKDYIKTNEDHNCETKIRKFKPQSENYNYKNINSILSYLDRKVTTGDFLIEIKNNDKNIFLKANEIVFNAMPGSKQKKFLEDEKEYSTGSLEKYDQFFTIILENSCYKSLSSEETSQQTHFGLSLENCEFLCMNDLECNSFSYCDSQTCITSSLFSEESIKNNSEVSFNCFISKKNYIASYSKHENRGITNFAKKKLLLTNINDQKEETCAKFCSTENEFDCLSFEYCDSKLKDKDTNEKVCLLHDFNLVNEKEQELNWDFTKSHCDHFTRKHSKNYKEYSFKKLKDVDLSNYSNLPLEKCAVLCDENELCNSFDYCIEKSKVNDLEQVYCHLSTNTFNEKNSEMNLDCSIYDNLTPKTPVKKVIIQEKSYSVGFTVFSSFIGLIAGSAFGTLLSFLLIKKCFFNREEENEI